MRAIRIEDFSGAPLRITDVAKPVARPGFALVKMLAAGINPIDDGVRRGYTARFPGAKPPPIILGHEGVGEIEESVEGAPPAGTRVLIYGAYGIGLDGTWADYVLARPEDIYEYRTDIQSEIMAGVPLVYVTAYFALTIAAGLLAGQSVLIPGIGGGVGNAGYQLARSLGAGLVIGTAGSTEKATRAERLGFANVIDLQTRDLVEEVTRLTGGRGVDAVLDSLGGPILTAGLEALAPGGILISVGSSAGGRSSIDLSPLRQKLITVKGFNPIAQIRDTPVVRNAIENIVQMIERGDLQPLLARTFPLSDVEEALRFMKEERPFGKTVVTPE